MKTIAPIGFVKNTRLAAEDDAWGEVVSVIELVAPYDEQSLHGLDSFSHAEIIFYFHQVREEKIVAGARRPRNNQAWPLTGIFAQRGKNRPNRLGLTTVKIINLTGKQLTVEGLDAINGTPIIDIKPVMREFLPKGAIRQPAWAGEIMQRYWQGDEG